MKRTLTLALAAAAAMILTACGMPNADTPLTRAAQDGDFAAAKALLARGADPDQKDSHGLTPLVRAARRGDLAIVEILLESHADPNLPDSIITREGWTPLMNAVHKNQLSVGKRLIQAGADVNYRTAGGNTALALASGDAGSEFIKLLLDSGANPQEGKRGSLALTNAVALGRTDNVRVLLQLAPEITLEAGVRGRIAIGAATLSGSSEILEMLRHRAEGRGEPERPAPAARTHAAAARRGL